MAAVRAVDIAPLHHWHQLSPHTENMVLDLRRADACDRALEGATSVYNLAADMGGMGFIEANKACCMLSVLINTHLLESARRVDVRRFFYASSACVYAQDKQRTADLAPLKESDAYPADPEDGYVWEKLKQGKLIDEIVCELARETNTDPITVDRDVHAFIDELKSKHLLTA